MAISENSRLDWTDIADLFSALNTQRKRFSFDELKYEKNSPGLVKTSNTIEALVDGIETMLAHENIKGKLTVDDIDIPKQGTLVKPFNIQDKITTLKGLNAAFDPCPSHNGSFSPCDFNATDHGFGHSSWGFTVNNGEGSSCKWGGSATQSGTVTWNSSL